MQIETLRYFTEISRCSSLAQAAENLFVSPQGLGKAIRSLEEELGFKLIQRSAHGISLTPSGRRFLDHATVILEEYRQALVDGVEEDGAGSPSGYEGLPWIVTPYMGQSSAALNGSPADSFAAYRMTELPFDRALITLEQDNAFCALTAEVFPWNSAKVTQGTFRFIPWFHAVPGIIWKGECPVANALATSFREIDKLPKATITEQSILHFYQHFLGKDPFDNILFSTANMSMIADFVSSGNGIGMFDSFAYTNLQKSDSEQSRELHFTPIREPGLSFQIGFIYTTTKGIPEAYRRHVNLTKAAYLNF